MKTNIYSVFDEKAGAFITPFFLPTDGQALRAFTDCVRDRGHEFSRNSPDYRLYRIGTFDQSTGETIQDLEQLALAANLKAAIRADDMFHDAPEVEA